MLTLVLWERLLHRKTKLHNSSARLKQVETTKSEIETLEFERSILSHSIASAYEMIPGSDITTERDRLVTKYKSQLDNINEKIGELQLSVEFSELSEARNNLVSLLQAKITSLDGRISEMSHKYGLSTDHQSEVQDRGFDAPSQAEKIDSNPIQAKGVIAEFSENKSADADVIEVQQEILQALNRLENVGTDYELLTDSNKPELNGGKAADILTSQPAKAVENQDFRNRDNVPGNLSSVSRDAVSSLKKFNPH